MQRKQGLTPALGQGMVTLGLLGWGLKESFDEGSTSSLLMGVWVLWGPRKESS